MAVPGKKSIGLVLCLLVVVCAGLGIGLQKSVLALDNYEAGLKELKALISVMTLIQEEYVNPEKTKTELLINGAIHGMVSSLDRYSVFFERDEAKEFNDQTQGNFSGLGIQIDVVDGWLTVIEPMPGTPASKAGILGGDRIVEIEGKSTKGISIYDAQKKLKGKEGTSVTLTVARRGEKELIEKTIIRARIETSAVEEKEEKMLDKTTGYIRLRDFTKDAADELETTIKKLQGQGMQSLILDLRDNVGGLLDVAVRICELFVDKGQIVVSHRDRKNQETVYRSERDPLGHFLLAVLVNEFSASASEIVAGCIQDYKRGILVGPAGHKTFGKGSVQTLIDLKALNGASLKLTTAKYHTPKGRSIDDEKGLTPDIFARVADNDRIAIRRAGKSGFIPPEFLGMKAKEATPKEATHAISVDEVFKPDTEKKVEEEDLYDVELYTAYECLKAAEVLRSGTVKS